MACKVYILMTAAFVLLNTINLVKPHVSSETSSSDDSDESDVTVRRKNTRSYHHYKGLPIENHKPQRRKMEDNEISSGIDTAINEKTTTTPRTTTTTTEAPTTRVSPPLNKRYRRVYNPDEIAMIEEFPFMAALVVNDALWCGAVIIDKDRVLTAAHCLQLQYNNRFFREYVKMLTVRVGSTNATAGGEILRVAEIFFHPNYKPDTLEFNFAVLKLHRALVFGKKDSGSVEKIDISNDKVVPVDHQITFLGWGSVLGTNGAGGQVLLQKVSLPVYDLSDCQEIYGKDLVTRTNFCAGYITIPKNVCNHDAGGPAIMDGRLIGILSFSSKRCDTPDHPAVFSSVGAVGPWIENLGEKKVVLL